MLPKGLRLRGRGAFEAVFRGRKMVSGPEISLFYLPTTLPQVRIGFAFKQKSFPRAVTRHFLKRKGSAIMMELLPTLPSGRDLIVLFQRPSVPPLDYTSLKKRLEELIKRLK